MLKLKQEVKSLSEKTTALYFAFKDPRTPLAARLVLILVLAYALSPIDLIPDFIPVLGCLDDIIVLPVGISIAVKLIPPEVWEQNQLKSREGLPRNGMLIIAGAGLVMLTWLLLFALAVCLFRSFAHG